MIDRLEVTPGEGTVIRFGYVAAWASRSASPALISFLAVSARNLARVESGGQQLADHLAGILRERDPEPGAGFAVVGPSADGWDALLHGPVQIWDGVRWVLSDPVTGWTRCPLWPQSSVAVGPAGTSVAPVSPDAVLDLEAGAVPGGGFLLVPSVAVAVPAPGTLPIGRRPEGPGPGGPDGPPAPEVTAVLPIAAASTASSPWTEPEGPDGPGEPGTETAVVALAAGEQAAGEQAAGEQAAGEQAAGEQAGAALPAEGAPAVPVAADAAPSGNASAPAGPEVRAPAGVIDLRPGRTMDRPIAHPPLPPGPTPAASAPGAPVVAGTLCPRGHVNRPGMTTCGRCGQAVPVDGSVTGSGTRPALGCLIVDSGLVFRLDEGYLVGSDPARDPTVRGRLARPLVLEGVDVSASHAEVRLHDWDVLVTDRASDGGTFVYETGSDAWERLRPYQPRVLRPGTHVAFGQRVATFVTRWAPPGPP